MGGGLGARDEVGGRRQGGPEPHRSPQPPKTAEEGGGTWGWALTLQWAAEAGGDGAQTRCGVPGGEKGERMGCAEPPPGWGLGDTAALCCFVQMWISLYCNKRCSLALWLQQWWFECGAADPPPRPTNTLVGPGAALEHWPIYGAVPLPLSSSGPGVGTATLWGIGETEAQPNAVGCGLSERVGGVRGGSRSLLYNCAPLPPYQPMPGFWMVLVPAPRLAVPSWMDPAVPGPPPGPVPIPFPSPSIPTRCLWGLTTFTPSLSQPHKQHRPTPRAVGTMSAPGVGGVGGPDPAGG